MSPGVELQSAATGPTPVEREAAVSAAEQTLAAREVALRRAEQALSEREAALEATALALAQANSALSQQEASLRGEIEERRKAEVALAERANHLALLNEITQIANATLDLDETLQRLADRMGDLIGADGCFITSWDEAHQAALPLAAYGPMRDTYRQQRARPDEKTLTQAVLEAGRPLVAEDVYDSPYISPHISVPFPTRSLLGLPLIVGGQKLGGLLIGFDRPHVFSSDEVARCQQAAGHVALAIAKARLFATTKRDAEELAIASKILHVLNAAPDVREVFAEVAEGLRTLTGCQRVSAALLDPAFEKFQVLMLDPPEPEVPGGQAYPANWSAGTADVVVGRPHMTPDLLQELDYPIERDLYQAGHRSRVNLPLHAGNRVLGSLNLTWPVVEGYAQANIARLSQIADAVALAVERSQLFEETRRRNQELVLLNAVADAASRPLEPAHLLDQVLAAVLPALDFDAGWVMLPGPTLADPPLVPAGRGVPAEFLAAEARLPLASCVACRTVLETGRIVSDTACPACQRLSQELIAASRLQCHLAVPIQAAEKVLGILVLARFRSVATDERLLMSLATVGRQVGLALENARLYQALQEHANALEATVERRTAELKAANTSLMAAAERLRELDQLKSQFVSNVSHELRTPLTNIKLYLSLLERGKAEKRSVYMATLKREANLLHRLIEDLLDLSRLDLGKLQPVLAPVDANRLAAQWAEDRAALLAERRLRLVLAVAPDLPPVLADAGMLAQVLTNLMSNAMNYTPPGGTITIGTRQRTPAEGRGGAPAVALFVSDTGCGIPEEDQAHIFERFYRGQAARQSGAAGTGLGLAISHEIITRHGGYITVESRVGQGSTFTVWLAAAEQAAGA